VLLILLMLANLVVGLFILPGYIAWRRPHFVAHYAAAEGRAQRGSAAGGRAAL